MDQALGNQIERRWMEIVAGVKVGFINEGLGEGFCEASIGTARIILVGRMLGAPLDVHGFCGLLLGSLADDGIAGFLEELDLA